MAAVKLDEMILEAACFVLRARFRFVAIQVSRGPAERVEATCVHATRDAKVSHGLEVAGMMRDDCERILSACERARVVGAVERGESAL